MKKILLCLLAAMFICLCPLCFAESEKIPIKVINNTDEAIGQELIKILKDGIDQSGFSRLVITEPSKIEIIVTTKNKFSPRKIASLNNLEAKRFEGMTISANNPYIGMADSYLTSQQRIDLREKAADWEAKHNSFGTNVISYSIVWVKKDGEKSIYLDTMMGFCEENTMNLIINNVLTKTSSIIDKSL